MWNHIMILPRGRGWGVGCRYETLFTAANHMPLEKLSSFSKHSGPLLRGNLEINETEPKQFNTP